MTTSTLPPRVAVGYFSSGIDALPVAQESGHGTWIVRDLKIFRVGMFKDSLGRQNDWNAAQLAEMVSNFTILKEQGIFPNVPVRADHSDSVQNVLGYLLSLRSDGMFLYADVEFTEPEAAAKYSRGTYRSRSVEIGPYETNGADPETIWPAVLGLAFVDLPAVEGLFRQGLTINPEDNPVTLPKADPTAPQTFRIRGVPTTDTGTVQAYIEELEKAGAPKPHAFRINGQEMADVAAVQTHVDTLEKFRSDTFLLGRDSFVDGLVSDNKIMAPQAEGLKTFARTLADEQFEAFKASYVTVAPNPLFARQAGGGAGGAGDTDHNADAVAVLEETVAMHRRAGMTDEQIAKTESYKRLQGLKGQGS